jgi:hypothetical protein
VLVISTCQNRQCFHKCRNARTIRSRAVVALMAYDTVVQVVNDLALVTS